MREVKEIDWKHFSHDADMGIRGYGGTCAEAFASAAVALTAVITDPEGVQAKLAVDIHCTAPDSELLFNAWINALVYEMATRRMLFGSFDVGIEGNELSATAWGEAVSLDRHEPVVEVKGATLTALRVERLANGRWLAQCVVDV